MIRAHIMDGEEVDKRKVLNIIVVSHVFLTVCFFICASTISGNANAGFNVMVTAILYSGYAAYLGYCFNKKRHVEGGADASMSIRPMVGGVLIGLTTMFIFLSLMTAIYWGEFSHCDSGTDFTGYSCIDASGMAATSWFASFLLIAECVTLGALVHWKDDLFQGDLGYENFDVDRTDAFSSSSYAYDGANLGGGLGPAVGPAVGSGMPGMGPGMLSGGAEADL